MTSKQEDKLSMWTTVDTVLTKYRDVWPKLMAFDTAAARFRKIRIEVDPQAGVQISSLKGFTDNKRDARQTLAAIAAQMAMNIVAYALEMKDFALEKQFTFVPSYFDKIRDNLFPVIVNAIITKATELGPILEPYGITERSIQDLTDALEAYSNANASPRAAVGERKTATVNIVAKLNEGMQQLEIMDKLVGNFSNASPNFVSAYHSARMIIHLGSRTQKDPTKHPPLTAN